MIANISNITTSFSYSVEYNEYKKECGKAKLLQNNTGSIKENTKDFVEVFNETVALNTNVHKNIGLHISISLSPEEKKISNEKFLLIANDYLDLMGYGNCPNVIYRHFDNNNPHLHIITTSVDFDGKKINEWQNYSRSVKISRKLEIKHNIKFTIYNENKAKRDSLNVINARRYFFQNALFKGLRAYNSKARLKEMLDKKELTKIYSKRLDNKEIKNLLGENRYNSIYTILDEHKLFNVLFKDELIGILLDCKKNSLNTISYLDSLNKKNITVSKKYDKNKNPYLLYGFKKENFFIKDKKIPMSLQYKNIFPDTNKKINSELRFLNSKDLNMWLKKEIAFSVNNSESYNLLGISLAQKGIEFIPYKNKEGIYKFSFKLMDLPDKIFPAEKLSSEFTKENIDSKLKDNIINHSTQKIEIKNPDLSKFLNNTYIHHQPYNYNFIPAVLNYDTDTFENYKKKKKRESYLNRD